MALERRFCANHADRPAIGICVVTKKHICAECSTRVGGVNYSKEGLALLAQQRSAGGNSAGIFPRLVDLLLYAAFVGGCLFLYASFQSTMTFAMDWEQAFEW